MDKIENLFDFVTIENQDLEEELTLDENIPRDLAKAYKGSAINLHGFNNPSLSGVDKNRELSGANRKQAKFDYSKANYEKITPEQAREEIKKGNIESLRFVVDGQLVEYEMRNGMPYQVYGNEWVDYDHAYVNRKGNSTRNTREMTPNFITTISDAIYKTDEYNYKIDRSTKKGSETRGSTYSDKENAWYSTKDSTARATDNPGNPSFRNYRYYGGWSNKSVFDTGAHKRARNYNLYPYYEELKDYEEAVSNLKNAINRLEREDSESNRAQVQKWKKIVEETKNELKDAKARFRYNCVAQRTQLRRIWEDLKEIVNELHRVRKDLGNMTSNGLGKTSYKGKTKYIGDLEEKKIQLQKKLDSITGDSPLKKQIEDEIEKLEQEIAQKKNSIKNSSDNLSSLTDAREALNKVDNLIAEYNNLIANTEDLKLDIAEYEDRIAELGDELDSEEAKKEVLNLNDEINELEKQEQELVAKRQQLERGNKVFAKAQAELNKYLTIDKDSDTAKTFGLADESLNEATLNISSAKMAELDKEIDDARNEVSKYNIPFTRKTDTGGNIINEPDFSAVDPNKINDAKKALDRYNKAVKAAPDRAKDIINYTEALTEAEVVNNKNIDGSLLDLAKKVEYGLSKKFYHNKFDNIKIKPWKFQNNVGLRFIGQGYTLYFLSTSLWDAVKNILKENDVEILDVEFGWVSPKSNISYLNVIFSENFNKKEEKPEGKPLNEEVINLDYVVKDSMYSLYAEGESNITPEMVAKDIVYNYPGLKGWREAVEEGEKNENYKKFLSYIIPYYNKYYKEIFDEGLEEAYSEEELDKFLGKTYNQQKVLNIYKRTAYDVPQLFAHTKCTKCGKEKRVILSNLISDPEKYGSCKCSKANEQGRNEKIIDIYRGKQKLPNNTSGYTGVYFLKTYNDKPYNKWRASIEVDKKRFFLGDFDSKKDAIEARKKAAKEGVRWYKEHKPFKK